MDRPMQIYFPKSPNIFEWSMQCGYKVFLTFLHLYSLTDTNHLYTSYNVNMDNIY